jgi:hypothetical protein
MRVLRGETLDLFNRKSHIVAFRSMSSGHLEKVGACEVWMVLFSLFTGSVNNVSPASQAKLSRISLMDKHGFLPNWGSTDHIDTETLRMPGFFIHLPFSS